VKTKNVLNFTRCLSKDVLFQGFGLATRKLNPHG